MKLFVKILGSVNMLSRDHNKTGESFVSPLPQGNDATCGVTPSSGLEFFWSKDKFIPYRNLLLQKWRLQNLLRNFPEIQSYNFEVYWERRELKALMSPSEVITELYNYQPHPTTSRKPAQTQHQTTILPCHWFQTGNPSNVCHQTVRNL